MIRWPWDVVADALRSLKPPEPDTLRDGERLHGCPKCMSTLPAASVLVLRSWVTRDGVLVSLQTGERVACQAPNCTHQYSLHAGGAWQHNQLAEPLTAIPPGERGAQADPEPNRPPGEPPAWPAARSRPII